jgi:TonB-linked SusC/RagA family outer membrane protein
MKAKFNGFLTLLIALSVQFVFAQKTVSGTVSDDSGPLPGVSVLIKGTKTGAETDFDGKYSLQAKQGEVLVFSYVGKVTVEKQVGATSVIDVVMVDDSNILEEVVITAQGISKEKKALGYAVTNVSADELEAKPQTDIARLLTGKSPGVKISQTGGLSGSGTNIIVRGYSSIGGNNQPLFVVDGVPFDSSVSKNNSSFLQSSNAASRYQDIDPNNIQSLSILKGLSATTLYGEAGRNGVILITTKTGNNLATKNEVTISSSYFFNEVVLPDYTQKYGAGFYNDYGPFFSNWGAAYGSIDQVPNFFKSMAYNNFDGQLPSEIWVGRTDLDADYIDYKPHNSQKDYFKSGGLFSTFIGFAGAGDKASYIANYGYSKDDSFLPNNTFTRNSLSVGGNIDLTNKFKVAGKLNFSKSTKVSPVTDASFGSDVYSGIGSVWNVLYLPTSVDLKGYPYEHPITHQSVWYRSGNDRTNPLWITKYSADNNKTHRVFGNVNLSYNLTEALTASFRFGLDWYNDNGLRGVQKGAGDGDYIDGYLRTYEFNNAIIDNSLIVNYNKDLTEKFNLNLDAGYNYYTKERVSFSQSSEKQIDNAFGYFNHQFFTDDDLFNGMSEVKNDAFYAQASLGYNNYMFLTLSGRRDKSSLFEPGNNVVYTKSASLSIIPTTMIEGLKGNNFLNYLKLRANYGEAPGLGADPYGTKSYLGVTAEGFYYTYDPLNPSQSYSSNYIPNTLPNPNLKPEVSKELEFGLETKMLKNRLSIDLTYYNKNTEDQLLDRRLPSETGYDLFPTNFGLVNNTGIELGVTFIPFKDFGKGMFTWELSSSFNKNKNIVKDTEGQIIPIAGFTNLGNFAVEGEPFGVIMGSSVARDINGNMLVNDEGNYVVDPEVSIIGDPNPEFTTSLVNDLSWHNFRLSAQLEYQQGGDIYSTAIGTLVGRGLTTDTEFNREGGFILPGLNESTGLPNDVVISATDYFFDNYALQGADEFAVFDATNLRLREVSLSYSLSKKNLEKLPFGNITVGLTANNLFVKAFNVPEGVNYDPEINSLGVGNGQGFDFLTSWNSRRYGFNVKLTF